MSRHTQWHTQWVLFILANLLSLPVLGENYGSEDEDIETEFTTLGEQAYVQCTGCHSLTRNRTGPRHCGVFGRQAGTQPGYNYSETMSSSSIIWDADNLDKFLSSPFAMLPRTTMGFAGVKDKQTRTYLIEYLQSAATACEE